MTRKVRKKRSRKERQHPEEDHQGWTWLEKRKTAPKNVRFQALDVRSKDEIDNFLESDRSGPSGQSGNMFESLISRDPVAVIEGS